ncbi:MAG: hypothetical protein LBR42_03345 [Candidatus Methanoplasma sp.]|nr:hypothetical protein [Candidatus Methanoplasma sp.]
MFATPASAIVVSPPSEARSEFMSYYDQLSVNGKAMYDAMEGADAETTTITVDLPMELRVAEYDQKYAKAIMKKTFDAALTAMQLSSPLAYWGWDPSAVKWDMNTRMKGDIAVISSVTLQISLSIYREAGEFPGVKKMLDDLNDAVGIFKTNSTMIRDKVRDINNYLVDMVTYDPNCMTIDRSIYSHDAYGALVDPDHHAVCDGYAKAFLLLCQKEGIKCVVVLGTGLATYENHAWNYVKLDNNKWYAVDVTWNDRTNNAYFLLGGDEFFKTHQQGVFLESSIMPYTFFSPPLSRTSYDYDQEWHIKYAWLFAAGVGAALILILCRNKLSFIIHRRSK